MTRVPQIEVVVMHTLNHQETGAGFAIDFRQRRGIELLWIPVAQDFLVADLGRMAVTAQMILARQAGLVEIARIPIATFAGGLRPEVNPDAELRVAQPRRFARVILLDGSPGRLEWPGSNRQIQFELGKRSRIAQ